MFVARRTTTIGGSVGCGGSSRKQSQRDATKVSRCWSVCRRGRPHGLPTRRPLERGHRVRARDPPEGGQPEGRLQQDTAYAARSASRQARRWTGDAAGISVGRRSGGWRAVCRIQRRRSRHPGRLRRGDRGTDRPRSRPPASVPAGSVFIDRPVDRARRCRHWSERHRRHPCPPGHAIGDRPVLRVSRGVERQVGRRLPLSDFARSGGQSRRDTRRNDRLRDPARCRTRARHRGRVVRRRCSPLHRSGGRPPGRGVARQRAGRAPAEVDGRVRHPSRERRRGALRRRSVGVKRAAARRGGRDPSRRDARWHAGAHLSQMGGLERGSAGFAGAGAGWSAGGGVQRRRPDVDRDAIPLGRRRRGMCPPCSAPRW